MKSLSIILLSLFSVYEMLVAVDICSDNNGNIQISEVFYFKNKLFIFLGNGTPLGIDNFKWDGNQFSVGNVQTMAQWEQILDIYNEPIRLAFLVDYPQTSGYSSVVNRDVVTFQWKGSKDSEWKTFLIEIKNGMIIKSENISIDVSKCETTAEPLRLCSLFTGYKDHEISDRLLSITSFPTPIAGLSQRVFVYLKGPVPQTRLIQSQSQSQTLRYVFVGQNTSVGTQTQRFNWVEDKSTEIENIEGVAIDAATALTDYKQNGHNFHFDLIEFFGTQFSVYRVSISKDKVYKELKKLKSGSIGEVFGCNQSMSETSSPVTKESELPVTKESELPVTEKSELPVTEESEPSVSEKTTVESSEGTTYSQTTTAAKSRGFPLFIILVVIIVLTVIFAIIVSLVFCRNSGNGVDAEKPPPVSAPKPASPPVSAIDSSAVSKSEETKGKITLRTPSERQGMMSQLDAPGSDTGSTLSIPSTVSLRSTIDDRQ